MVGKQMTWVFGKSAGVTVMVTAIIIGSWFSVVEAQQHAPGAGTYSSMFYNGESGDINGDEIRIVATRKGFQGTVQFGRGEPTELILSIRSSTMKTALPLILRTLHPVPMSRFPGRLPSRESREISLAICMN